MMGIQLLEDPSLDQVSRTKKGGFFNGAGSLRKGEKEGWEKYFDLVQGESALPFLIRHSRGPEHLEFPGFPLSSE
jgi:hypothetical protein